MNSEHDLVNEGLLLIPMGHFLLSELKTNEGTEKADSDAKPTEAKDSPSKQGSQMLDIFGFEWQDFTSWSSFVGRMSKPLDPASLGILRISFGKYEVYAL